ncbi:hypothetical protein GOP47_0010576 [Adiantum capillus-veneris]|uniref:BRCT domain-containing protein n=1 Tax=Adiantum capillus-veneris TaxID=13818 RepID=A0A9D4UVJ2_ADICA|nr:hypothetical protein GOP47_0010576 [Adiantum capillus-veneris]
MGDEVRCEWHVRSCSSEAEVHAASNALKSELYRMWQTAQPTEEACLVLEARPPSAFAGLEIVNAGSALVELYGLPDNHGDNNDDDGYVMLLSAQQLMSTKDVINKENRNRSFTYTCSDKLSKLALQQRWKRIKVVCRQPFGSEDQKTCIGLSRLSFTNRKTLAEVAADAAEARLQQNLKAGLAKMFPNGSSNNECEVVSQVTEPSRTMQTCQVEKNLGANEARHGPETPTPLRGKRKLPIWQSPSKQMKNGAGGRGDASHGAVSSEENREVEKVSQKRNSEPKVERPEKKQSSTSSKRISPPERQEKELTTRGPPSQVTKIPEAQANSRLGSNQNAKGPLHQSKKISEACKTESTSKPKADGASQSKQTSPSLKIVDQPGSSSKMEKPPSSTGKKEATLPKSSPKEVSKRAVQSSPNLHEPNRPNAITLSFSKFLDGVIFAISGLVNPERAEIRDKALEMGGQYRPDWGADCTLLICAFANTPKFNQVQNENGTIVSKVWILECYQQKKLVDIEKYLMHAGKPWRQIGASALAEPDDEGSSPIDPEGDKFRRTLASLRDIEKWVQEDVALSIAWLKQQEVQPEAKELHSIAVQGIQLCLDDAVECLRNKQSIKKVMESWDFVPRAVRELAGREDKAGKARKNNFWSDMLGEAERLKWIYSKELKKMAATEEQRVEQMSKDGEDVDTEDVDTEDADTDVLTDDASSEDTQVLDEDDIREAKEAISKMISGFT